MGTERIRGSQQTNAYWMQDDPTAGDKQSMESSGQDQSSQSMFPSTHISTSRPFADRFHSSTYPVYAYQNLQSSSSIHNDEASYAQYLHSPMRLPQTRDGTSHSQYHSYQPTTIFPRPQNPFSYDITSHLQPRPSSTLPAMTTPFEHPTYVSSNEPHPAGVTRAEFSFLPEHISQHPYEPSPLDTTQIQPSFNVTIPSDFTMTNEPITREHDHQQQGARKRGRSKQKLSHHEQIDHTLQAPTLRSWRPLTDFEHELKTIFSTIIAGRIKEASQKLLNISRWLLCSETIERFSLNFDDKSEPRKWLPFWREFNYCWEALGQKQKNMTEETLRTSHFPTHSPSLDRAEADPVSLPDELLSAGNIVYMLNEFVAMCDQIEKYGLVDYEIGVWEEEIVSVFIACLDLLSTS